MLEWTKALIRLRRSIPALNDGGMHRLRVSTDDRKRTVVLQRDEVRIVANLGAEVYFFDLLEGEKLSLISRAGVEVQGKYVGIASHVAGGFDVDHGASRRAGSCVMRFELRWF